MTWAHVVNGQILEEKPEPHDLIRLDNGASVLFSPYITNAQLVACGWLPVVDVARPADTPTTTTDRTLALVAGVPTVVWASRAKTVDEVAAAAAVANDTSIRDQALTALADNRTFIALVTPTNAQAAAQVKALSRQMNGAIRLLLGRLDGTD